MVQSDKLIPGTTTGPLAREIAKALLAAPEASEIESDADLVLANEHLSVIVGLQGQVLEAFDPIIKSQRAALSIATEKRKGFMDPLVQAEKQIKAAMTNWLTQREVPSIEATVSDDPEDLAPPPPPLSAVAGTRKMWQYEILNVDLLRPEFKIADMTKIGKIVRALGKAAVESVSLPGQVAISVEEKTILAAKRK